MAVAPLNIKLDDLGTPDNNTDLNATTDRHGLLKMLGGGTANFLRADGSWASPGAGGTTRKIGVIKTSGSVAGGFTGVQNWVGTGPYTASILHGYTLNGTYPVDVSYSYYNKDANNYYIKAYVAEEANISASKLRVTMPNSADLYVFALQ